MTRPSLRIVHGTHTHAQTVELALQALSWAMCDEQLPRDLRRDIALVHARLHACRPSETVQRMERDRGIGDA